MEFRLLYRGKLPAQSSGGGGGHILEKHLIRKQIHVQLRELWKRHPFFSNYFGVVPGVSKRLHIDQNAADDEPTTRLDLLAHDFTKFGYRFVPLVCNRWGIGCSLDILFLRRDDPGQLIQGGGDIDNRIKVLWDGLRIPQYNREVEKFRPEAGEDPFFCLMEDDRLITEVRVVTDRLVLPMEQDEQVHDVHLVIHVKTKILDPQAAPSVFGH
ncbi:MAG: hypothetical protein ACHP7P_06465 [Terriglobales bacterium]